MRTGLDFGTDRARDSRAAARAVKFRIMVLMILLLAVIFAMKEAGKPERWMWMGFEKIDQSPGEGDFLVDASGNNAKSGVHGEEDWTIAKSASAIPFQREEAEKGKQTESAIGLSAAALGQESGNEHDREFWLTTYKRLSEDKKLQLFGLLRKVVRSDFSPTEDAAALTGILKRLAKEQSDFQTLALGEISLLSDPQEKQRRTEVLFEFDKRWQTDVVPTLNAAVAGEDYTFAGQIEIRKVVQVLRPMLLSAVEDMAGMGTRSDLPGWLTVWDEAVVATPNGLSGEYNSAGEVSFLQLSGQPDNYRGHPVFVKGQARTCRKKLLKETRLPVDHYYEVWVEPLTVDGDGLFCVYAAEIPDSFTKELVEREPGKFHEVDVTVSLTGRFFKVRSYRDLGGSVSHSPVVIARRIDSVGTLSATEKTVPAIPGRSYLMFWFLGIGALATGLAVAVFRTTRTPSRQLGHSSTRRMSRSLEMLEQDASIKSPAERVAELAETEDGDSGDQIDG